MAVDSLRQPWNRCFDTLGGGSDAGDEVGDFGAMMRCVMVRLRPVRGVRRGVRLTLRRGDCGDVDEGEVAPSRRRLPPLPYTMGDEDGDEGVGLALDRGEKLTLPLESLRTRSGRRVENTWPSSKSSSILAINSFFLLLLSAPAHQVIVDGS